MHGIFEENGGKKSGQGSGGMLQANLETSPPRDIYNATRDAEGELPWLRLP